MTNYGREVIEIIMKEIKDKAEVVTIEVAGCNREIIRQGAKKIFRGENFEKLNEEVAEYADMLVIIEGGEKSGTILLANNFVEKGKNVYCVPGRITDDNSQATNWLISQGAGVIFKTEDLTALTE
ncbi:MAG: putative Rossmann fold nucleotide-binding protein involved in DNA uptake [Microgenomates group bacterium GW2011_GWA2_40_6]|nr:MAG: putative Rossmann fold nucleotide-binding protein involved in DNA uptake [Microgenomates group bacterium GW2011_GWA2_40_6]